MNWHRSTLADQRLATTTQTIVAAVAFAFITGGQLLADGAPPPAWKIEGFRAALRDPHPDVLPAAVRYPDAFQLFGALDESSQTAVALRLMELITVRVET